MKRDTFWIACTIIVANMQAHSHIHPDICPVSVNVNWLFGLTEDQTPRVTDSSYSNAHSLYRQVHIFTLSWLICHRGKKETQEKRHEKWEEGTAVSGLPEGGYSLTDRIQQALMALAVVPRCPGGSLLRWGLTAALSPGVRQRERERESIERVPPQFMSPLHTRADRVLTGPDFWVQANKYTPSVEKENRPLYNFMVLQYI